MFQAPKDNVEINLIWASSRFKYLERKIPYLPVVVFEWDHAAIRFFKRIIRMLIPADIINSVGFVVVPVVEVRVKLWPFMVHSHAWPFMVHSHAWPFMVHSHARKKVLQILTHCASSSMPGVLSILFFRIHWIDHLIINQVLHFIYQERIPKC